jgi:uncharacterized protein YecT (DUF1311 family)
MIRRALPLMALLFALSPLALADELADGLKAMERHDFTQAHAIFSKLAAAGNPEAQRQLGEMYGFGDGVPEDPAKAEEWLKRAQAGGSKDAAASLQAVHQRATRKADIAYYVSKYDGAELSLAKHGCVRPNFPERSETKGEMKKISAAMTEWLACYKGFANDLGAAMPAGKAIPEDVANLMSASEFAAAQARMNQVYAAMAADAKKQATELIAANDAWVKQTESYVKADNAAMQNDTDAFSRAAVGRSLGGPRAAVAPIASRGK